MYVIDVYEKVTNLSGDSYRGVFTAIYYSLCGGESLPFIGYDYFILNSNNINTNITVYKTKKATENKIEKILSEVQYNSYMSGITLKVRELTKEEEDIWLQAQMRQFTKKRKKNNNKKDFYTIEELKDLYVKYRNILDEKPYEPDLTIVGKVELLEELISQCNKS